MILLTTLLAFSLLITYHLHARKKGRVEFFDKHGKLTEQACFIIQKGVRENNTLS